MSVKISNLPPVDSFSGEDEIVLNDNSEQDVKRRTKRGSILQLATYLAEFLAGPGAGGTIEVITDNTKISNLQNPANWQDSYGNQADIGGTYVGPVVTGSQGNYYVDSNYKYELLMVGAVVVPRRFKHTY